MTNKDNHRKSREHFVGCLLGGAVGDALGAPVESLPLAEISRQFGPEGISNFAPVHGRRGALTDDTQMTLFTAEGLLRAQARHAFQGVEPPPFVEELHGAYLRWLKTQGEASAHSSFSLKTRLHDNGWLMRVHALHNRRGPGKTCLSALRGNRMGTLDRPLNTSKGCGTVMRVAPVGLFFEDPLQAFHVGCLSAAITHGHPTGALAAGTMAAIISHIINGLSLEEALQRSRALLVGRPEHEECSAALDKAVSTFRREDSPTPWNVEFIGGGWVAEEALAVAVYCALASGGDFARGVRLAVNHSGDSDSTGAITGNILGALLGARAIPARWLEEVELRHEIQEIAADLLQRYSLDNVWRAKYPLR